MYLIRRYEDVTTTSKQRCYNVRYRLLCDEWTLLNGLFLTSFFFFNFLINTKGIFHIENYWMTLTSINKLEIVNLKK